MEGSAKPGANLAKILLSLSLPYLQINPQSDL
jgi:hypothetical protein